MASFGRRPYTFASTGPRPTDCSIVVLSSRTKSNDGGYRGERRTSFQTSIPNTADSRWGDVATRESSDSILARRRSGDRNSAVVPSVRSPIAVDAGRVRRPRPVARLGLQRPSHPRSFPGRSPRGSRTAPRRLCPVLVPEFRPVLGRVDHVTPSFSDPTDPARPCAKPRVHRSVAASTARSSNSVADLVGSSSRGQTFEPRSPA